MVNTQGTGAGGSQGSQAQAPNSDERRGDDEPPKVTDELKAAIAEEVAKVLREMIPNLLKPQDDVVQESQKGGKDANEGQGDNLVDKDSNKTKGGCTYKQFLDCKPKEFNGTCNPVEAITWLNHIEKMFRTSKCLDEDKVEYATNLLRFRAQFWWDVIAATMEEEVVPKLKWEEFKIKFKEEYCSDVAVRQLEESFMQLQQGTKSVLDYTAKFNERARFSEHQVNTEKRKMEWYL